MAKPDQQASAPSFLRGGGETGALIATHDWAATPLGPLSAWPESLKNATALILQASVPMAVLWGEEGVTLYNDAYSALLGKQHPAVLGSNARETSPVRDLSDCAIRTALQGRTLALRDLELRVDRGGRRQTIWFDIDCSPLLDDDGRPAGALSLVVETTARVLAERRAAQELDRLQRIQQRLSAALDVARLGSFEWNLATGEATLDARAREIYGFAPDEPLTVAQVVARIDAHDRAQLTEAAHASFATGRTRREFEYRLRLPDGTVRNVITDSDTLPGPRGEMERIIGVFVDVTERRRAESRQRLLVNELNHRVKNTLATVQSVAMQTLRSTPDPASAREGFEARLVALAAAHDLLNAESWHGARLADLVASAMAPFESNGRLQVSRGGPQVWLPPQRALALSMALHELATNASKHGALSWSQGRVAIRWSLADAGETLVLSWVEHGGPPVTAPVRTGFGSKLLQRSLPRELGGAVELLFAPHGLRCTIRCRLEPVRAAPEFDIAAV